MSYLLDTNVISEPWSKRPNPKVKAWLQKTPNHLLYLSVLSLGEIRRGVEKLQPGEKKTELMTWLEQQVPAWFDNRLLPIDHDVADRWGHLLALAQRSLPVVDSLLAATALKFNLTMVTRNVQDFDVSGLRVLNPWD